MSQKFFLTFSSISLSSDKVEKRTVPHFKAWNLNNLVYFIQFWRKTNRNWAMIKNICDIFFGTVSTQVKFVRDGGRLFVNNLYCTPICQKYIFQNICHLYHSIMSYLALSSTYTLKNECFFYCWSLNGCMYHAGNISKLNLIAVCFFTLNCSIGL